MAKIQKKPTLYKTPFTKAYWRDAALELKDTRVLVFAALMIALRVALKGLYIPLGPTLRINSAFFINALGAMVFGPVVAGLAAIVSDFLGYILWPQVGPYFLPYVLIEISGSMIFALFLYRAKVTPTRVILSRFCLGYILWPQVGPYFLPYVLIEISGSMIFALFLYRAKVTPTRVILSRFCIDFFVNIVLNAPITYLFYKMVLGKSYMMFQIPHIVKNLAMFPIESVLLTLFLSAMIPITNRMRLTYPCSTGPDAGKLRFNKKQIALLSVLFVIGVGCVFGYLNYYYATTSLSANYTAQERYEANTTMNYTAQERYEANTTMTGVVVDQCNEFDDATLVTTVETMTGVVVDQCNEFDDATLVTTVESAYKKFMGKTTTYNVALYVVDEAALEGYEKDLETIRGLSKSKAKAVAEDGVMTRSAEVVAVLDNKTGDEAALEGYEKDLETIRGLSKSKAKAVAEDGVMTRSAEVVAVLDNKTGEVVSLEGYEKDLETIRGLSKSKAKAVAEDGVMTRSAEVVAVLDNKTGEVVSFQLTEN